jgi:cell division protease FtsH
VAEELIFGAGLASIGRNHDREQVTMLAAEYIRRYGFDPKFQANYALDNGCELNKFATDRPIENMITQLVAATQTLLKQHEPLLRALALELAVLGDLEAAQVAAIALQYGLIVEVREEGFLQIPRYHQILLQGAPRDDATFRMSHSRMSD